MATPYWGDLPKVSNRSRHNTSSGDYSSKVARRSTSGADPSFPLDVAHNRASIRTNNTDGQTESPLSPYASTSRDSYQGQGLTPTPRPLSQSHQTPDMMEKRRRRASRNKEEDEAYAISSALPPLAFNEPDASAASYKHPYGNGGLPYTLPKTDVSQQADIPPSPGFVEPDFYKPQALDRTKRASTTSSRRVSSDSSAAAARNGSVRQPGNGRRKVSLDMYADTRSPLQKLEQTLGGMNKDEKRTRLEAEDRNAHSRVPSYEIDKDQSQSPTVRFKDQAIDAEAEPAPRLNVERGPESVRSAAASHKAVKVPAQQRTAQPPATPQNKARKPKAAAVVIAQEPSVPHRDLSFRERAARNDMRWPESGSAPDQRPVTPPTTAPTGTGFSLSRSGSNKLKKEPPAESWYQRKNESSKKHREADRDQHWESAHTAHETEYAAAPASVGPSNTKAGGGPVRNRVPPLNTAVTRLPVRQAMLNDDLDSPLTTGDSFKAAQYIQDAAPSRSPAHSPFPFATDPPQNPQQSSNAPRVKFSEDAGAHPNGHNPDNEHHISELFHRHDYKPGQGLFKPTKFSSEWKKGIVGTLSGTLLELHNETSPTADKVQTWWETSPSQRRNSNPSRPRKAEAFDGEYHDNNAPTRFNPPLYLKCGPLLRYCGMRTERITGRSARHGPAIEREFWRGTVMIVTSDNESSYDITPTLRLFAQPIEKLPTPPAEVRGEVPPEYVDPIAGLPQLGRRGETLYVRPVDHLDEGKDLSRDPTAKGLFEKTRSPPDIDLPAGVTDAPGSFADRKRKSPMDGEQSGKYKDIRGCRLHSERGYTFWRFSIEVELRDIEQRIAYRINRGPATGFWVPAKGESMNIMFHSCNGFSLSVNPDELSGPDPLWRDVLNNHQSRPFHVMLGGGDQLYCDAVMQQTRHFQEWLTVRNPLHKHNAPFTPEMQDELEVFYLERYCMWFSQGLFGLANSQIPMVNMYDDHDIIDGFGSYPHHFMTSPVFSGLGNVAFKYYMLFQHQSILDETEETEPSWIMGLEPGPYIHERSRSVFMSLGAKIALLAVDARTERTRDQVVKEETWDKLMDRCYEEVVKGKTEHLLVLLGVPIAYPRLVWLENILTSRLLDPIKALGKTGLFGNVFNKFDGGVEVLDDLDDHWTAKNHKDERKMILEDLQDLAADRSIRITILSGDVHLAAMGQFYSNPKLGLPKHKDFRYMPNVISSAIVNTPPPDLLADVLNKRNKVHHLDKDTDEDMIPLFAHGVEGKPRNNKRLLPHRNWCSIREYTPGQTPPSTPPESVHDGQKHNEYPPGSSGGTQEDVTRKLSKRGRGPASRPDVINSKPPISSKAPGSGGGGLFRTLSSRGRRSDSDVPTSQKRPGTSGSGRRTLSLTRGDFKLFGRGSSKSRKAAATTQPDENGTNGSHGGDSDDPEDIQHAAGYYNDHSPERDAPKRGGGGILGAIGLRGGGGSFEEFSSDDDSYFTAQKAPAPADMEASSRPGPSAAKAARLLGEDAPLPGPQQSGGGYGTMAAALPRPLPDPQHYQQQFQRQQQQQQLQQQQQYFQQLNTDSTTPIGPGPVRPSPFHRTPTSSSANGAGRGAAGLLKRTTTHDFVNVQGGLDICINVEVSAKDPAGITVPYRLLVPKLWYDAAEGRDVELPARGAAAGGRAGGIKRLLSFNKGKSGAVGKEMNNKRGFNAQGRKESVDIGRGAESDREMEMGRQRGQSLDYGYRAAGGGGGGRRQGSREYVDPAPGTAF
ncbi:hypothetical protein BD289DRAFT_486282 [Coniella lustricola]|uniref:PhoD-like phosphatase domain-containing protein n=1 Tax=Coniella lustricola TaxID=2025994 RepID=A0A2T2ZVM7_9PEZI|nr:hypothetical protein BD289DRAFT_486282 [Coniella lustricola]